MSDKVIQIDFTKPENLPVYEWFQFKSYPGDNPYFTYDKTGTIYQVTQGDNNKTAPWSVRVWRCKPKEKPVEIFAVVAAHGALVEINGRLIFGYTTKDWIQQAVEIPGFIPFGTTPSGTVVNVDEKAMAAYKAQVALAQTTANQASFNATQALSMSQAQKTTIDNLSKQIASLQSQITTLQSQILSKQSIEDIVWTKIWDVNYLIRQGFRDGQSVIREVQDYLVDLASYIKRVMKG